MSFIAQVGLPRPALFRVVGKTSSVARVGAILIVAVTAGCAGIQRSPQREVPQVAAPSGDVASTAPSGEAPVLPEQPAHGAAVERRSVAPEPSAASGARVAAGASRQDASKAGASIPAATPKTPAKGAIVPAPAAPPPKLEAPATALAKPPAASPLDLKALESRLKETKAIGVFTKLTLKNQVDDLLDQFRAFYQGRLKTTLADLRQSYDRLILKVLALLQDADPPLAVAIASSREPIWGILSNPAKFSTV